MSPILVRPVREQLEHDRVIRLLQAKYKRKFEVGINPGNEQGVPVGTSPSVWYPDLVLQSTERSRKLVGVVEVETAESVNNLEAMSQWVAFAKLRVPFHLYVPQSMIDPARRLCADLQVPVAEVWMYHLLGDQMRFTLVQRSLESKGRSTTRPTGARPAARAAARASRPDSRARRPAAARSARRAAPAPSAARRKAPATKSKTTRGAARTPASTPARKKAASSSRSQKRK